MTAHLRRRRADPSSMDAWQWERRQTRHTLPGQLPLLAAQWAAVLAAVLALQVTVACQSAADPAPLAVRPPAAPGVMLGAVAPSRPPTTVAGWRTLIASTGCAGDGNVSVRLGAVRVLWLTGDAVCGGQFVAGNTATLVTGGRAEVRKQFAPLPGDGTYYWPGTAFMAGGRLHVLASRLRSIPGGWQGVSVDMLTYAVPPSGWPVLQSTRTLGSAVSDGLVQWSAGSVRVDAGTVVFGQSKRPGHFGRDVTVGLYRAGRFEPGPLVLADEEATPGPDTAFTVWRDRGGFHFLSKPGGGWATEWGRWDAPGVAGPWRYTRLGSSTSDRYLIRAHPEIPLASGRLLVTTNVRDKAPEFTEVPR